MDNRRNFYRILYVQSDAPTEIVRASYRALMATLQQHPDREDSHWRATLIRQAYAVLSDPEAREAYDSLLALSHSVCGEKHRLAGSDAPRCMQTDDSCPVCGEPRVNWVGEGRCPHCDAPWHATGPQAAPRR